jgi:hypothetical protein
VREDQNFAISSTDELSVADGAAADRIRKLDEFKPTNSPLSANDLQYWRTREQRTHGWVPRTTGNISELVPIPEGSATRGAR